MSESLAILTQGRRFKAAVKELPLEDIRQNSRKSLQKEKRRPLPTLKKIQRRPAKYKLEVNGQIITWRSRTQANRI